MHWMQDDRRKFRNSMMMNWLIYLHQGCGKCSTCLKDYPHLCAARRCSEPIFTEIVEKVSSSFVLICLQLDFLFHSPRESHRAVVPREGDAKSAMDAKPIPAAPATPARGLQTCARKESARTDWCEDRKTSTASRPSSRTTRRRASRKDTTRGGIKDATTATGAR